MAATSLDSVLNFIIPVGIVIAFVGFIYWKLKQPIDALGRWLWKGIVAGFNSAGDALNGVVSTKTEITYK